MAKILMTQLRYIYGDKTNHNMDLGQEFDSCTVLPYCLIEGIKKSSVMGWHCDSKYKNNGTYMKNPQVENTPVIIVSYGTDRILKWRRVFHTTLGWVEDKSWHQMPMTMNDKKFMLLHPIDEIPIVDYAINESIRYEHGNVRTKKNSGMSIAFVFRVVSTYNDYDITTNTMIPPKIHLSQKKIDKEIENVIKREKLYGNFTTKNKLQNILQTEYNKIIH